MNCLVTGATGFIGAALCDALEQQGEAIQRCGREAPTDSQLAQAEVIYHCAGIAHRKASEQEYKTVNHDATLTLASRAAAQGVGRFVFISSVNAARSEDVYGDWKRKTELALTDAHGMGMSVVSVRPALVYGKGARGNLAKLIALVRCGMPTPPPGGHRSMISLDDLCWALRLLAHHELSHGCVLVATDGESYSLARLHAAIRAALGRRGTAAPGQGWIWRLACAAQDLLRGLPGSGETWQQLFATAEYSNASLLAALPWQPKQTFESCIASMLRAPSG